MKSKIDISKANLGPENLKDLRTGAENALEKLWSGKDEYTGWVKLPLEVATEGSPFMDEISRVIEVAGEIQERCQLFIVIGIGGSYLGARAAIEALGVSIGCPEIRFAGCNLSGTYHAALLEDMSRKETCLCVISKSGTTLEPGIAFSVFKEALVRKYGPEEAARRIFAVTDRSKGVLREECNREGYRNFTIPDDIGGRYSVLSPVGLFPMAVAGIDIKALLRGAFNCAGDPGWDHSLVDYGVTRYAMQKAGKMIEVIEFYEPRLSYFAEWLKQLYGESEGKEGKGLFPASLSFTADLHSMGQFLQEGSKIFFETVLNVLAPDEDVKIPENSNTRLAGRGMNDINQAAVSGVMKAHEKAGTPMVRIDIPRLDPEIFGELIYFFETTCAITAYMMGVDPFDQPGVEAYKEEMRSLLF